MKIPFLRDIKVKIFALLLAVVSWLAIRATISFEASITDIPIEIKLGGGWAVLDQSDFFVEATFRGAEDDIRQVDKAQLKASIDLSTNLIAGPVSAQIVPSAIKGVRSLRVVRVKPDHVRITLDREEEKLIPVSSRTVGKPYYGEVERIVCEPAAVSIRGPARQLARTEWVHTEPVDVENRVQSFIKRSHVLPPSAMLPYQIEPPDVLVHITISEKSESIEWKDVPVMAIVRPGTTTKAEVTPERVNVKVTGRADMLAGLTNITPKVFVDCADLDPSLAYDLPVNVYVPVGLEAAAVADPVFVRVMLGQRNH